MGPAPILPCRRDGALPPLPMLMRWLERARRDGASSVTAPALPFANAGLPDLFALAGIPELVLERCLVALPLRWSGARGMVLVRATGEHAGQEKPPEHTGELPPGPWAAPAIDSASGILSAQARLADAAALIGIGSGADWERIPVNVQRRPPPPPREGPVNAGWWAFNPLPFRRRGVATLPLADQAPAALIDSRGGIHAVQMVAGAERAELLVELDLAAAGSDSLTACAGTAATCHWEVSARVLDNGRLRAEFDRRGRIERMCCDGEFIPLAGPLVDLRVAGEPPDGEVLVEVLERGPVRSRVCAIVAAPGGVLRILYTLHAGADALQVEVAAPDDGIDGLTIHHPTQVDGGEAFFAGESGSWTVAAGASISHDVASPRPGAQWVALGAGLDDATAADGLAVVATTALVLSLVAGDLRIHGGGSYALAHPRRRHGALPLGQLALASAVPFEQLGSAAPEPLRFHLADEAGLLPLWMRRPAGWRGELILSEQRRRGGRACLFTAAREAWRVDLAGNPLAALPPLPERDGFAIDHRAGEILVIRWR